MHEIILAEADRTTALDALSARLAGVLSKLSTANATTVTDLARRVLDATEQGTFSKNADLLNQTCARLYEIGESSAALAVAKHVAVRAEEFGDITSHRRIANILGVQYGDIADYASAMKYLEIAIALARKMRSALFEAAGVANVIGILQDMGHYRQALSMIDRVLLLDDASNTANLLKLQCASIGLYAAHRAGDADAAARLLQEGEKYLALNNDPLRRAYFEKNRVWYLIDLGRVSEAQSALDETKAVLQGISNARIDILMSLATTILEWSMGLKEKARAELKALSIESRRTKFYHHFVLQALVKVYSNAANPNEAKVGMDFARELVEYTTSVKKAKFYRQIAEKRTARDESSAVATIIDPFETARDWLTASEVVVPHDDRETPQRRQLAKHEELTVIHEDMAKLRAMSIRRDIRTDAVDTAENWAIAAEFFDDETGQHCYRVGHLASMLAQEIGMDETFCAQVEHAARLHDIGKIAVNEVILLKPGPLDAAEMAAMRLHTEVGAQILSGSDDPILRMATDVARHHHEWWNGGGYPTKRSGKDIPMSARVCAYADVYDALTHMRAYKKAWTHERALEEITRLKGVQFDPDLLDPFIAVLERYRADLDARAIPGFADMDSNALIASRRKLMETISAGTR